MNGMIHSEHGSSIVIRREINMVRLYTQITSSTDRDWDPHMKATIEEIQSPAKRILKPYYIEWVRVEWYSAYLIGQGISEKYIPDH